VRVLSDSVKKNVEAIAQLEHQLHGRRSRVGKIGDWIAQYFGSLWFIAGHAVFFTVWVVANAQVAPGVEAFDPYPFPFLGFIVGIEFIFLTRAMDLQAYRGADGAGDGLGVRFLTRLKVTAKSRDGAEYDHG